MKIQWSQKNKRIDLESAAFEMDQPYQFRIQSADVVF